MIMKLETQINLETSISPCGLHFDSGNITFHLETKCLIRKLFFVLLMIQQTSKSMIQSSFQAGIDIFKLILVFRSS